MSNKVQYDTKTRVFTVFNGSCKLYKTKGLLRRGEDGKVMCLVCNSDGVYQFKYINQLPSFDRVLNVLKNNLSELEIGILNENYDNRYDDDDSFDYYSDDITTYHHNKRDVLAQLSSSDCKFFNVYKGILYYGGYSEYTGSWLIEHIVDINNLLFVELGLCYMYDISKISISPYSIYRIWKRDYNWGIERVQCRYKFDNGVTVHIGSVIPSELSQTRSEYTYYGDDDAYYTDEDYDDEDEEFRVWQRSMDMTHIIYTPEAFSYAKPVDGIIQEVCKVKVKFPKTKKDYNRLCSLTYYREDIQKEISSVNIISILTEMFDSYNEHRYNTVFERNSHYISNILKKDGLGGYNVETQDIIGCSGLDV